MSFIVLVKGPLLSSLRVGARRRRPDKDPNNVDDVSDDDLKNGNRRSRLVLDFVPKESSLRSVGRCRRFRDGRFPMSSAAIAVSLGKWRRVNWERMFGAYFNVRWAFVRLFKPYVLFKTKRGSINSLPDTYLKTKCVRCKSTQTVHAHSLVVRVTLVIVDAAI